MTSPYFRCICFDSILTLVLTGFDNCLLYNVVTYCIGIMNLFVGFQPCQSNPCENKGTCSKSGKSYNCACSAGYTGRQCESTNVNVNLI